MTVSNTNLPPKTYTCNGVTTNFPTTFPFFEAEDLVVTFIPDVGEEQTLVLNSDYTVSGGNGNVGTVTTIGAGSPYDDGTLHIDRVMNLTQLLDLMPTGNLRPDDYEKGLDVLTLLAQQLQRGLNKSLHLSPTSLVANPIIPEAPNRMIGWNGDASGFTTYPPVITYTPLSDGRKYDIDPYESDQGANSSEGNKTIKDFLDIAGTTTLVTLRLKNLGPADTTTYPVLTGLTIPSNVYLEIEPGAILDNSGVNIYMANAPRAGPYQIFTGSVFFASPQIVYPEWWGALGDGSTDDSAAIQYAIDSCEDVKGGIVQLQDKIYVCNITLKSWITLRGVGTVGYYSHAAGVLQSNQTTLKANATGNIIGTPITAIKGPCVEYINFLGLGAATALKGLYLDDVDRGTFRYLAFDNIADQAIRIDEGIGNEFYRIIAINCLLNRTRTAKIGVIDLGATTDNYFDKCEASASQTALSDGNLYLCAWAFNDIQSSINFLTNCIGEFSDIGFYINGDYNRLTGCRADQNFGHGFELTNQATKNQLVNCLAVRNSKDNNNTYDGFNLANVGGNLFVGCNSHGLNSDSWQQRYGYYDATNSSSSRNHFIGCGGTENGTGLFYGEPYLGAGIMPTTPNIFHFTANDSTPSVGPQAQGVPEFFKFYNYTLATDITDFDDGLPGQTIYVLDTSATQYVTIKNNSNIKTLTGKDILVQQNRIHIFRHYNGVWYEVGSQQFDYDVTAAGAGTDGTISSRSANPLGECDGFIKTKLSDGTPVYVPYWENIAP